MSCYFVSILWSNTSTYTHKGTKRQNISTSVFFITSSRHISGPKELARCPQVPQSFTLLLHSWPSSLFLFTPLFSEARALIAPPIPPISLCQLIKLDLSHSAKRKLNPEPRTPSVASAPFLFLTPLLPIHVTKSATVNYAYVVCVALLLCLLLIRNHNA